MYPRIRGLRVCAASTPYRTRGGLRIKGTGQGFPEALESLRNQQYPLGENFPPKSAIGLSLEMAKQIHPKCGRYLPK